MPDNSSKPQVIHDEDKTPELLMEILGIGRAEAEMILAIERGEIEGDIVAIPDPSEGDR